MRLPFLPSPLALQPCEAFLPRRRTTQEDVTEQARAESPMGADRHHDRVPRPRAASAHRHGGKSRTAPALNAFRNDAAKAMAVQVPVATSAGPRRTRSSFASTSSRPATSPCTCADAACTRRCWCGRRPSRPCPARRSWSSPGSGGRSEGGVLPDAEFGGGQRRLATGDIAAEVAVDGANSVGSQHFRIDQRVRQRRLACPGRADQHDRAAQHPGQDVQRIAGRRADPSTSSLAHRLHRGRCPRHAPPHRIVRITIGCAPLSQASATIGSIRRGRRRRRARSRCRRHRCSRQALATRRGRKPPPHDRGSSWTKSTTVPSATVTHHRCTGRSGRNARATGRWM